MGWPVVGSVVQEGGRGVQCRDNCPGAGMVTGCDGGAGHQDYMKPCGCESPGSTRPQRL